MKYLKMISKMILGTSILFLLSFSCNTKKEVQKKNSVVKQDKDLATAYFASGCFWCVEAIFESVEGVEEAVSGYAGGHTKNPTYKSLNSGNTGHAETVAVYYNPKKVDFKTLVAVYYNSHNPTTKNGQHPDYGTQYRAIAFYQTEAEQEIILATIKDLNEKVYNGEIATEVTKLDKFYPAEKYHQNYEKLHPENPYIRNVSIPRLNKFKRKMPEVLKKKH